MRTTEFLRRTSISGNSAQIARERLLAAKSRDGITRGLPAYTPPTDSSAALLRQLLDQNTTKDRP